MAPDVPAPSSPPGTPSRPEPRAEVSGGDPTRDEIVLKAIAERNVPRFTKALKRRRNLPPSVRAVLDRIALQRRTAAARRARRAGREGHQP